MINCPRCRQVNRPQAKFCSNCRTPLTSYVPRNIPLGTGQLPNQYELTGRYVILRCVGQGGMGAVYQAMDKRINNKFWAVKEMSDSSLIDYNEKQEARKAFEKEAQMLATLSHVGIPKVGDFFEDGGKLYFVMEFVQGDTLEKLQLQQGGYFDETTIVNWAIQLCDVLHYLHHQTPPIIFRDLKPSNIMVEQHSGKIRLIDFGIARLFHPKKQRDTVAIGTEGFAPPEQYVKQTDARSDIYALGATLYRLLTNQLLPRSLDRASNELLPLLKYNATISSKVEQAILKSLALRPEDRFQNIKEFQQALSAAITNPNISSQPLAGQTKTLSSNGKGCQSIFYILLIIFFCCICSLCCYVLFASTIQTIISISPTTTSSNATKIVPAPTLTPLPSPTHVPPTLTPTPQPAIITSTPIPTSTPISMLKPTGLRPFALIYS